MTRICSPRALYLILLQSTITGGSVSGTRSLNGCWTCRLRRKKCDELRPRCATCKRLGIRCLEYGNKLDYMDGGLKEKKKAGEIKDAIKATKLRKEHLYHADTGNTTNFDTCETPRPTSPLQNRRISYQQLREDNIRTSRSPSSSDVLLEKDYVQHVQPGRLKESAIYSTELECVQSSIDSVEWLSSPVVDQDNLPLSVYHPSLETTDPSPTTSYSGISSGAILDLNLLPSISIHPTPSKHLESDSALLLMHYMDHVLYIQFPFYNDALSHHGRAWLLSLITTVKPICMSIFDVMRFLFCICGREFSNIDLI